MSSRFQLSGYQRCLPHPDFAACQILIFDAAAAAPTAVSKKSLTKAICGRMGLIKLTRFQGIVHHGGKAQLQGHDEAGRTSVREQEDGCWCTADDLLFIQGRTSFRGMAPLTFRVVVLST